MSFKKWPISLLVVCTITIFFFQNCDSTVSSDTPFGSGDTDDTTDGLGDSVDPADPVDPTDGDNPTGGGATQPENRLAGFIDRCNAQAGVYSVSGSQNLCKFYKPALQASGDIGRLIWAYAGDTTTNAWVKSGANFSAAEHAVTACKTIMRNNNVYIQYLPTVAIRVDDIGVKNSEYWDFKDGGWRKIKSPNNNNKKYWVLTEIVCQYWDQDGPVGKDEWQINFSN